MAFRTNKTPVLQEKSASGAVASFNTALAMPLSSCNIAVNAWQEGSGEPSPVNNRPIHGFSEVNATRAGKNLIDVSKNIIGAYINSLGGETTAGAQSWAISDYIPVAKGGVYTFNPNSTEGISSKGAFYDENKQYLPNSIFNSGAITITVPSNAFYVRFSMRTTSYDVQLEAGSTATAYEPYVTPTIYTIQFGQEVYGAEVDVVNGVAHVNKGYRLFDGSADEEWINYSAYYGFYIAIPDMVSTIGSTDIMFNYIAKRSGAGSEKTAGRIANNKLYTLGITNNISEITDLSSWREWLSSNNLQFVYPLAEPFDIQLTPTQIETLIGNNTIFADTGDIDLTYKDLDIAKRGNFREVFKLPS